MEEQFKTFTSNIETEMERLKALKTDIKIGRKYVEDTFSKRIRLLRELVKEQSRSQSERVQILADLKELIVKKQNSQVYKNIKVKIKEYQALKFEVSQLKTELQLKSDELKLKRIKRDNQTN